MKRQLQHQNVLSYHAAFVSGPEVIVVAPLMAFGSCKDLLSSHFTDGLPEEAIAFILRDVLQGLDYIHRKEYIHRYESLYITYLLTPWCRVLLEMLTGLQLVKKFPHFMEPEGSLPYSQASATCPYPGPTQSSQHTHIPPPGDPS